MNMKGLQHPKEPFLSETATLKPSIQRHLDVKSLRPLRHSIL
jgi:hypothetical protein